MRAARPHFSRERERCGLKEGSLFKAVGFATILSNVLAPLRDGQMKWRCSVYALRYIRIRMRMRGKIGSHPQSRLKIIIIIREPIWMTKCCVKFKLSSSSSWLSLRESLRTDTDGAFRGVNCESFDRVWPALFANQKTRWTTLTIGHYWPFGAQQSCVLWAAS